MVILQNSLKKKKKKPGLPIHAFLWTSLFFCCYLLKKSSQDEFLSNVCFPIFSVHENLKEELKNVYFNLSVRSGDLKRFNFFPSSFIFFFFCWSLFDVICLILIVE